MYAVVPHLFLCTPGCNKATCPMVCQRNQDEHMYAVVPGQDAPTAYLSHWSNTPLLPRFRTLPSRKEGLDPTDMCHCRQRRSCCPIGRD